MADRQRQVARHWDDDQIDAWSEAAEAVTMDVNVCDQGEDRR